jgi:exo-poly-alpha-galacturonosidase
MFLDSQNIGVYATSHTTFNTNNGDGLEFGGSENAVVANNFFDTGDDIINFAAGQGKYGASGRATHDVWMFGNYLRRGHGGVAVGSHTAAWIHDLLAEDNVMYLTETGALRMKSTSDMSGGAYDILFRDTAVRCMATSAFIASLSYSQSPSGYVSGESAAFRNIRVANVSVDSNNSTTCGMPDNNKRPVILIEAGPAVAANTVGPFIFDHVRFRNVSPTSIEGLTNSMFENVCFENVLDNANPWRLDEYSTDNQFVNVSPMPGAGGPSGSCQP